MNYANSKMAWLISEFVHSERDRQILSRRFLDGISQDAVANEIQMSKRHIQNISFNGKVHRIIKRYIKEN